MILPALVAAERMAGPSVRKETAVIWLSGTLKVKSVVSKRKLCRMMRPSALREDSKALGQSDSPERITGKWEKVEGTHQAHSHNVNRWGLLHTGYRRTPALEGEDQLLRLQVPQLQLALLAAK